MDISLLVQESVELLRAVKQKIQDSPGQMNLLDLTTTTHLENKNSNIIAFLLDPKASHHHPEFGEKFLSAIKLKCTAIVSNKINSIWREYSTDQNRRIDLLIETDSEIIIIENKIYATDLDNQVNHYIDWATRTYRKKNVIALYLNLDGSNPASY